jgi:hypothetical protein
MFVNLIFALDAVEACLGLPCLVAFLIFQIR